MNVRLALVLEHPGLSGRAVRLEVDLAGDPPDVDRDVRLVLDAARPLIGPAVAVLADDPVLPLDPVDPEPAVDPRRHDEPDLIPGPNARLGNLADDEGD